MQVIIKKTNLKKATNLMTIGLFVVGVLVVGSSLLTNNVSSPALRGEFGNAYSNVVNDSGEVVEVGIRAYEDEVEIVNGYKTKVWSYNGEIPGPEIRINLGDTLKVNFTNNLPDETTIHWHGVRVPNAMDGVPGVNQEPIAPGDSFVYEFTPKDAGTFWFHPHVRGAEQVERGLFGTLIVEDKISKEYSQDVVWILDDIRMTDTYQIDPNFVTGGDLMHDGRWGNVITVNGTINEQLEVRPGERIRLRLVNTSNGRVYLPSFGSLDSKIIAVDGMYVKEAFDLDNFEIAPGNRVDLDIKIPKDSSGKTFKVYDYYTRNNYQLAEIIVTGSTIETPDFDYPVNINIPDWTDAINNDVDISFKLNTFSGNGGMGMMGGINWAINNEVFPDNSDYILKYNEVNILEYKNESFRLHPMHLHGQFFKVISRNGVASNENYFRDTVLVHPNETVRVAIVPLDKGEWAHHCHILEHAESGMMNTIVVK
ncbi:MAG: multicopper oxidase family protein [Candidatus Dojkabacteria bacterium]|nr:multicopper oxidase family protein [Candidatus Dojkabacteria bacterium]MDQ7021204.1 multicopper oxidase family protein [Candidatus Dojkabacteria bacterium]